MAEMNKRIKMARKAAGSNMPRGSVKAKLIIIGVVVLVFIIAITALIIAINESKRPKGPIYNDKKPEDIDYHVAYTATVNAGFDLKGIKISKDDEKHEIVVSLPPIRYMSQR